MEQLLKELEKLIQKTREYRKEQPFLSDYENGCNAGGNDVIDDLENLLNKFNMKDKSIDMCLNEINDILLEFLKEEGGDPYGYYTTVSGIVKIDGDAVALNWQTPRSEEELTEKGKEVRGVKLYCSIQNVLSKYQIDSVLIRNNHVEYGCMNTEMVLTTETIKKLSLNDLNNK